MRPIYFLLFSLFVGQYLKAQPGFEYRQKLGFLLAHRGLMSHLPQAPAVASEFSYIYRTNQAKKWHEAYRQPLVGGTLFWVCGQQSNPWTFYRALWLCRAAPY